MPEEQEKPICELNAEYEELNQEYRKRILDLASSEDWNEDVLEDIAEWAEDFLNFVGYGGIEDEQYYAMEKEAIDSDYARIKKLSAAVVSFSVEDRYKKIIPLPDVPDGKLHGIGFIYDHDKDDRVLLAIDYLKDRKGIIAVSERKGCMDVYTISPSGINNITVCNDEWPVTEYVPLDGEWVVAAFYAQAVENFINAKADRRNKVLKPTSKQKEYLDILGYCGPCPETREQASTLIDDYKQQRKNK